MGKYITEVKIDGEFVEYDELFNEMLYEGNPEGLANFLIGVEERGGKILAYVGSMESITIRVKEKDSYDNGKESELGDGCYFVKYYN